MLPSQFKPSNSLGGGLAIIQYQGRTNGIRCYDDTRPTNVENLGSIRTFTNANRQSGAEIDLRGKKVLEYNPTIKKPRAQKVHLSQQQCGTEIEDRGIKTYQGVSGKSDKQYFVEGQLQTKIRVEELDKKRNGISVNALGDKSYKVPQHSSEFYKGGGLLPGSSIRMRKGAAFEQLKIIPLTRPNYDERVRIEQEQNDRKYLQDLQKWEQTILKDTVVPKADKAQKPAAKVPPKDAKKPAKK